MECNLPFSCVCSFYKEKTVTVQAAAEVCRPMKPQSWTETTDLQAKIDPQHAQQPACFHAFLTERQNTAVGHWEFSPFFRL
jgi:hypothetical protein